MERERNKPESTTPGARFRRISANLLELPPKSERQEPHPWRDSFIPRARELATDTKELAKKVVVTLFRG